MKYLLHDKESERLYFRKVDLADFDTWLAFHESPLTHVHWNEPRESPRRQCELWFEKQIHRYENDLGGMNSLIEKSSGKLIGYCGLLVQEVDNLTELEIGYSLLPEFWNNGYATEAAIFCRDQAFLHNWWESVISIIAVTNLPSQKVALRNGMHLEKRTSYKDNAVNIYRITKAEWKEI